MLKWETRPRITTGLDVKSLARTRLDMPLWRRGGRESGPEEVGWQGGEHLATLERQIAVVGGPAVRHDLGQRDALAWVLAQHAGDEVLETRRHCRPVGKGDGLRADDIVQPHDAGVLEWHRPCNLQDYVLGQLCHYAPTHCALHTMIKTMTLRAI